MPTGRCTPSSSSSAPSSRSACSSSAASSSFIRTFPSGENGDRNNWFNHPISLTLIAFVFTSVPALLLHKWSEKNLGSITAMALALLIGGIVMWIIDYWAEPLRSRHHPRRRDDPPAGHLDRPLPDAFRRLSRHFALHVHHRRRTNGQASTAPPPSNSASCSPSPP